MADTVDGIVDSVCRYPDRILSGHDSGRSLARLFAVCNPDRIPDLLGVGRRRHLRSVPGGVHGWTGASAAVAVDFAENEPCD